MERHLSDHLSVQQNLSSATTFSATEKWSYMTGGHVKMITVVNQRCLKHHGLIFFSF